MANFARKTQSFSTRLQASIAGGILAAYAVVFVVFGVGSNVI